MKKWTMVWLAVWLWRANAPGGIAGESFVVKDGKTQAEIVIAENPPRMVTLAAQELQGYLRKISGAEVPVVTTPRDEYAVTIYVGRSVYTDHLGVNDEGLKYGAFRMVSGPDWLILLGHDADFTPAEPWARSNSDWQGRGLAEWDKLTGAKWFDPVGASMYKGYSGRAYDFGRPAETNQVTAGGALEFWKFDQRGSLNAVYAYLRGLGVRWYAPGELGEILPAQSTIVLPAVNKTVRPSLDYRTMSWDRYHALTRDQLLWSLRLGLNTIHAPMHHGIANVTIRPEQRALHPEYYQVIAEKRDTESGRPKACLSSPGLFEENVRFVRTMFDVYNVPVVSVMPQDGFTRICQCPLCRDKATPERGPSGMFSDYVWDYVNRVAAEVAKTHPDRKIACGAYSTYQLPPLKIAKLHPNVLVQITNGRPRTELDPEFFKERDDLRKAWLEKTDNKLSISINYHFGYQPFYVPHVIARGLHDARNQLWREDCWFMPFSKEGLYRPGINHLSIYVLARLWWDMDQDVDTLLDEYYRLYYGPAKDDMKAFVDYCETSYAELTKDGEKIEQALALFETVKRRVDPDSVYGKRIALVDVELSDLRKRKAQLAKGRDDVPVFGRLMDLSNDKWRDARNTFVADGRLDEPFWTAYPHGAGLSDVVTGAKPKFTTTFLARWYKDSLYLGIRCQDQPGDPANIATSKDGDWAIWDGDHLEILLETPDHEYYQIVINPAGARIDIDRGVRKDDWFKWSSQAESAAYVGEDFWSVELRIPVTSSTDDPLHQVIGRPPSEAMPWFFNICRKRVRGDQVELSAYSPTGEKQFHVVGKFGKLYLR